MNRCSIVVTSKSGQQSMEDASPRDLPSAIATFISSEGGVQGFKFQVEPDSANKRSFYVPETEASSLRGEQIPDVAIFVSDADEPRLRELCKAAGVEIID